MARARNIKPAFFQNEILAELSAHARLCFIGLWTLADRDGRLEDRPKRIKLQLLPYDDVDVDGLLSELADAREPDGTRAFIVRYTVDGMPLIAIRNFLKHQCPHHREVQSTLPEPPSTVWTNNASPRPALGQTEASPSLAHLNPESPILNPESPTPHPESGSGARSYARARASATDEPERIGAILARMGGVA